jgi:hypothetical protein
MPRVRRTAFSLAAGISALLCAAALFVWAAFSDRHHAIEFQRPSGCWEVATDRGRLWLDNSPQVDREVRARKQARQLADVAAGQLNRAMDEVGWRSEAARRAGRGDDRLTAAVAALAPARANDLRLTRAAFAMYVRPVTSHSVPLPVVAAITAMLPVIWIARVLGRARRTRCCWMRGVCPACGYDLRASPDRCSECGTPRPSSSKEAASRIPEPST